MADVLQALNYCPESGIFTWKISPSNSVKKGSIAGASSTGGYIRICFAGKMYSAHRLAWFFCYGVHPIFDIDHIDGNPANNRLANLREATEAQNLWNRRLCSRNKSGVKGVCWYAAGQKWAAQIRKNGVKIFLGYFTSIEEAEKVVRAARQTLHAEFTNHGASS